VRRILTASSVFLLLFLIATPALFGQTKSNELRKMAEKKKIEFEKNKTEALQYAEKNNIPVAFTRADGVFMELMYIKNGLPVYYTTDNINAAATVSSDKVWEEGPGGLSLSGEGITLGVWDGGKVRSTHVEFEGRAIPSDNATSTSDHSTHVAGTIGAGGLNPQAKGMSYNATLNTYDWNSDESEMANAAANGLVASNHSYGVPHGWEFDYRNDGKWAWLGDVNISPVEDWEFGYYSSQTKFWDQLAFNAPSYLICRSAGNERSETGPGAGGQHWVQIGGTWTLSTDTRQPDGPYDCIQTDKIGKNILTVGAVNDVVGGYNSPSDVSMSSFSSWGPADDGRIKPDIVGNGVNLFSTSHAGDNSYTTMSGTSMSTPNVTGSIGLIQEHWKNKIGNVPPLAATVKGLIIHTADEAGDNPGPDYVFGWGLMNTYKAINLISYDAAAGFNNFIRELEIAQDETITIQVESNGNEPLSATICWTDVPGNPVPIALDPRTPMLVNDLDLRIQDASSVTYEPWKLDPDNPEDAATKGDNIVDNVEKVEVENTQTGTYTIKITHKGTISQGPQKFSLILSGIAMVAPEATSLVSPANGSTGIELEPILKWSRVETAESYQLEIALDTNFTSILSTYDDINVVEFKTDELSDESKLFWRVRAYNNGGFSDWSDIYSFETVIGIPQEPVLLYPGDDLVNVPTSLDIKWSSVQRAERYQLQLGDNSLLFSTLIDVDTLTDTTYSIEGLEDGTRYYWRVYAINVTGTSTAEKYRFYTELNAADSLAVLNDTLGSIQFSWADRTENEFEYVIERKIDGDNDFVAIDTIPKNSTEFTDTELFSSASASYRVYCINLNSRSKSSEAVVISVITSIETEEGLPESYALAQNFPNPFNPATTITFALPEASVVKLEIFNILGEKIATLLADKNLNSGVHKVNFNASGITSGVYLYRINAVSEKNEVFNATKKMIILK